MSDLKCIDAKKGLYEETESKKKVVTIQHVRKMISHREKEIERIQAEIDIWKEREAAIMALPGFEEPE
jgi:hypothetical protein